MANLKSDGRTKPGPVWADAAVFHQRARQVGTIAGGAFGIELERNGLPGRAAVDANAFRDWVVVTGIVGTDRDWPMLKRKFLVSNWKDLLSWSGWPGE